MENKKGFSILKGFVIVVCLIFIALSVAVNILFGRNNTPNIFGYYIYVLNNQDMGSLIPEETAIISKDASELEIRKGDVVLCHLNGSEEVLVRTVYKIGIDEATGVESYYLSTATAQDDNSVTDSIPRENIISLCTGYPQNIYIGRWINFMLSMRGIFIQLVFPVVLLGIFLIVKLASSKDIDDEDEDEDYSFYEHDKKDEKKEPLFVEPVTDSYSSDEFERKKQSIAEHFSHKEVNPNSPYQKEKERTMQFKALKAAENSINNNQTSNNTGKKQVDVTEMFKAQKSLSSTMQFAAQRSAESSFAARNINNSVSTTAPTADALREEMLRRTAEAEYNSVKPVVKKSSPAPSTRNTSSPNIDDIIKKSDTNNKKKDLNSMSVDDLLTMIENEKRKL